MAEGYNESVGNVLALLDAQREKLRRIHSDYATRYDAAFESLSAYATLERWAERTAKIIQGNVCTSEARKFMNVVKSAPSGRRAWNWNEACQFLDTHIRSLMEDIIENPNDQDYERINRKPSASESEASCPRLQFDVFLSYSTHDKDEAREIHQRLSDAGKACFLAEKNLRPGDDFDDEIRGAIAGSAEVWILVSPNSLSSDWVKKESGAAWGLGRRIVPVLLRCPPRDLPDGLSHKHAIDFHKIADHINNLR